MLALAYPDILMTRTQIASLLGLSELPEPIVRDDSADIIKWHGLEGIMSEVFDTEYVMGLMGIKLTVSDISKFRGDELFIDLNEPVLKKYQACFDIVLDPGTLEHCFNVGQAMRNIVAMLEVGGLVIHNNPVTAVNHGFFNFCPTFYANFYIDNGHELLSPIYCSSDVKTKQGLVQEVLELHPFEPPPELPKAKSSITTVAQKKNDALPEWPMQQKYKEILKQKGNE